MVFQITIEPEAREDIQQAIEYYNQQQAGLGAKFHIRVKEALLHLSHTPHHQFRYGNVRCFTINRFPYMVHFTVDEQRQQVIVHAVFHTALDPGKWDERQGSGNE